VTRASAQLSFDPLDPYELAELRILERRQRYDELQLDRLQRVAAEEAVRLVLAGRYLGRRAVS
jgi:hypothetical protein